MRYDVAFSYASEQEKFVRRVNTILKSKGKGYSVFYAPECREEYEALDMSEQFFRIYDHEARLVAVFASDEYYAKDYTMFEYQTAKSRSGPNCVIPIYFTDRKLPGMNADMHYIDARDHGEPEVAAYIERVIKRLTSATAMPQTTEETSHINIHIGSGNIGTVIGKMSGGEIHNGRL